MMGKKTLGRVGRVAAITCGVGVGVALLAGMAQPGKGKDAEPWVAPSRAAKKANPVPADPKSLDLGKRLFERDCVSCHGAKGHGDGPKSGELERKPTSFADAAIWDQSDGAFFWKITEGKAPMPSEKTLMSENERWCVINYMHTLAPPEATPTPPRYAVPETHRKAVSAVLKAYEPVRAALAGKGDGAAASKAVPALADAVAALNKVDADTLPEGAKTSWHEDAGALTSAVDALKAAGEGVPKLRETFGKVSASLVRTIEHCGHAEPGTVFVFVGAKGADTSTWLQTDAKAQDPYGSESGADKLTPKKRLGSQKKS